MFALSLTIDDKSRWRGGWGKYYNSKQLLVETSTYIYGISNHNPFRDFCKDIEKCPEWLKEVYVFRKIGNWMFWRGLK